ncbi:MAG: hypothetical protein DME97_12630 [Verrucomicrobia bacterium]|nr:MAG: hypothetical protein DME97_12630 [Verrucomicrobiota bacterium]
MGGAHRKMHSPWRANPKCSVRGAGTGKQSAAPTETPPRRRGNPIASNGGPHHQLAGETGPIELGSGKLCFVVKSERPG